MMEYDLSSLKPTAEGLFGPELILDRNTGDGCLRFTDGVPLGSLPSGPTTNGFLVWVGYPVVVLSVGIEHATLNTVASRIRARLGAPNLPVVATLGSLSGSCNSRIIVDDPEAHPRRDLARAEAYALVQANLLDGPRLTVELYGESFEFLVTFQPGDGGVWRPIVE